MKIEYKHYRFTYEHYASGKYFSGRHGVALRYYRGQTWWTPTERGGYTECMLTIGDVMVGYGVAECSRKDQFCYKTGREIAFGRAIKSIGEK